MGQESKIEWLNGGHTASPWHGCQHATLPDGSEHPACDHCYAEAMAKRNPAVLGVWGAAGTRVMSKSFHDNCRKWNAAAEKAGVRQSVFPSICDISEDWQGPILDNEGRVIRKLTGDPEAMIDRGSATLDDLRRDLFRTIDACPWLDFLLLTKRPENVRRMLVPHCLDKVPGHVSQNEGDGYHLRRRENLWLGTSISDQATANVMVPRLLECRDLSTVLFLSIEPLLGPVDLTRIRFDAETQMDVLRAEGVDLRTGCICTGEDAAGIDWVIVGGESGPHARPMHPDWVRSIVRQCKAAGVPVLSFPAWRPPMPANQSCPHNDPANHRDVRDGNTIKTYCRVCGKWIGNRPAKEATSVSRKYTREKPC